MKKQLNQMIAFASILLCGVSVHSQVLISSGTLGPSGYVYSQNFDSLLSTGSANTWTDNSTLLGWYASKTQTGSPAVVIYRASGGAENTGALYSYGTNIINAITDRALGSLGSGTPGNFAYGVRLTNDTANAISNITVSYTGEQWRNGGNLSAQPLAVSYQVSAVGVALTSSDAINSQTWVAVPALTFNTPTVGPLVTTILALDGNAPANRTVFTGVPLTGVVVLPGQEIFVRWLDINDAGNDHAVSVDDLTISYTNVVAAATPPVISVNPVNTTLVEGATATFSVTATGTDPKSYSWYSTNAGSATLISGATASSLALQYVSTNQTGFGYFVIITNVAGSATSSVAILTVTSSVPVPATIAFLRTLRNPTTYAVTDMTNLYTIDGIVTTPNVISGPLQSYFVQDATGGMDVFNRDGNFALPAVGDHVKITGPIFNFNGLLEMNITNANPSHHVVNLSSGNPLPTPAVFDFASASNPTLMETSIEGSLVTVPNVFLGFTNGVFFTAGGTIFMTNSTGGRFNISIPSDTIGDMVNKTMQSPPYASSVTGVISQNTSSVPTNGYSLLVYYYANINFTNNVGAPIPVTLANGGLTNSVISWPVSLMSLQSSTNVQGPYVTIPGDTSPYTNDMTTNEMNFFRLVY